jgi:hypothetical protein
VVGDRPGIEAGLRDELPAVRRVVFGAATENGLSTGPPIAVVRLLTTETLLCRLFEGVAGEGRGDLPELPELIDPALLHGVVRRLADRGDLAGGLFAVALTRPGASFEWALAWRELLFGLRTHPHADLRDDAFAIDMG